MEKSSQLNQKGYQIIDDFLTGEQCQDLLEAIASYRSTEEVVEVYRQEKERSLHYFVIDGDKIEKCLPEVKRLYLDINKLVNRISGKNLVPLSNKRVGVNINITSGGGEYRWHYDRNAVTAILYLNEVAGGETEMYPKYRIYLSQKKHTSLQGFLDKTLQLKLVRRLFGKKESVEPRAGRMLIMQGDRCLHSVRPVEGDRDRINLILSYDVAGANFPMEKNLDSYLYTQQEQPSSDPNYI